LLPEAILIVLACVLLLGSTIAPGRNRWGNLAVLALVLAGGALAYTWTTFPTVDSLEARLVQLERSLNQPADLTEYARIKNEVNASLYSAPVLHTDLGLWIKVIALSCGLLLVWLSWDQVPRRYTAEYHACLLLITAGIGLTATANELITLFLALELISIPTYVLLYLPRADSSAQEAAMKYFLLSVFSAGLMLFGFSYLYGLAGSTNITAIVDWMAEKTNATGKPGNLGLALVALLLVVAGLGFKITAVPFHFYAPDVYQGAPTPAVALLAVVPKVAGFVALARLIGLFTPYGVSLPVLSAQLPLLLWILAAVTMTLGNILALLQDNVKRLLAYSSVAHAGYMLIALAAPRSMGATSLVGGTEAIVFYLIAYGLMTIGAFAVISWLSTPERPVEQIEDLSGVGRTHPLTAVALVIFLFSLIGMPLTAGFIGKLMIFLGALQLSADSAQYWLYATLVIIGAINAAIGGYYYLRIIGVLYLRDAIKPLPTKRPAPVLVTIAICAILTLAGGIYPNPLVQALKKASTSPTAEGVAQADPPAPALAQRD
jgi:NADH-quinone oxidoreductase subunit N